MNDKEQLIEQLVEQMDKVFFYCVKRCNSRIDAEDLSQTILLEVLENIDKGARIDNLDYYVWGVCKNQYNTYLRKTIKNRNTIEYKEDIDEEDESKKTLEEIGNSYGVTKECIRQIEKRALNKIADLEIAKNSLISYIK